MSEWKLVLERFSDIEEKPWPRDTVKVSRSDDDEVDLMFDGASPGYVITIERDEVSEWLDTLVHISRKKWFTTHHARSFAMVMAKEARYPRWLN